MLACCWLLPPPSLLPLLLHMLLPQCVAITKDYNAAREAEMNQLLLELAANRAATRHAHELWLASRWGCAV